MLKDWRAWCQKVGVHEMANEGKLKNYIIDEWTGPDRGTELVGM